MMLEMERSGARGITVAECKGVAGTLRETAVIVLVCVSKSAVERNMNLDVDVHDRQDRR